MNEDGIKITPIAGRVTINKREAITGSVFLAIIISACLLVLVQSLNVLFFRGTIWLFWSITAVLIAADGVLCVLFFCRAVNDASVSGRAAPYTIAYRHDGFFVLCHKNGEREYIPAAEVVRVTASRAKLAFVLNGWAYSGNLNYGKVTFYISRGRRPVKKQVKYVVDCARAARFINAVFFNAPAEDAGEAPEHSQNSSAEVAER